MEQEVVSVWAGTHGKFDDLAIADVLPFEHGLLEYVDRNTDILTTIRDTGDFTKETEEALDKAVDAFRETYVTKAGKPLVDKKTAPKSVTPVDQEQIKAGKMCIRDRLGLNERHYKYSLYIEPILAVNDLPDRLASPTKAERVQYEKLRADSEEKSKKSKSGR